MALERAENFWFANDTDFRGAEIMCKSLSEAVKLKPEF